MYTAFYDEGKKVRLHREGEQPWAGMDKANAGLATIIDAWPSDFQLVSEDWEAMGNCYGYVVLYHPRWDMFYDLTEGDARAFEDNRFVWLYGYEDEELYKEWQARYDEEA